MLVLMNNNWLSYSQIKCASPFMGIHFVAQLRNFWAIGAEIFQGTRDNYLIRLVKKFDWSKVIKCMMLTFFTILFFGPDLAGK